MEYTMIYCLTFALFAVLGELAYWKMPDKIQNGRIGIGLQNLVRVILVICVITILIAITTNFI